MPLSEHEQRLLDEIEQALYAEDPKFASSVRSARAHRRVRSSVLVCALGILGGLALVLVGLLVKLTVLSVVGFVVLVAALGYSVQSLRNRGSAAKGSGPSNPAPHVSKPSSLRSRMEDRMRRRFDEN